METKAKFTKGGVDHIIEGIMEAAEVVISTMGPSGKRVGLKKADSIEFSRDGVSVARELQGSFRPPTPGWEIKNMGVQFLVDACNQTVRKGGDGTTTTAALVSGLLKSFEDFKGVELNQLANNLKESANTLVGILEEMSKEPTKEQLINLAIVSANNNEKLGTMIGELIWELGGDSFIEPVIAMGEETRTDIRKGYEIDEGFLVPQYLETPEGMPGVQKTATGVILNNPHVLIVEERISDYKKQLIPFYKAFQDTAKKVEGGIVYERPMMIICGDVEGEALRFVMRNLLQNRIPVFLVKSPRSGMQRYSMLKDIQAAVGAKRVYSKHQGTNIADFKGIDDLGSVLRAEITLDKTIMVTDDKNRLAVTNRIAHINEQEEDDDFRKLRISKLDKGVGVIYIGGFTRAEFNYNNEVIEDCVLGTQSAMKHGVVIGAGKALQYCSAKMLAEAEGLSEADSMLFNACFVPFESILVNAGFGEKFIHDLHGKDAVFNVLTKEEESFEDTQILDSFEVVRDALLNAASLVSEIIRTDYVIVK